MLERSMFLVRTRKRAARSNPKFGTAECVARISEQVRSQIDGFAWKASGAMRHRWLSPTKVAPAPAQPARHWPMRPMSWDSGSQEQNVRPRWRSRMSSIERTL
jgi:hypothetical protein